MSRPSSTFPHRLRAAREDQSLTREQLDSEAGLPKGTTAQYEGGFRRPTIDNFAAICRALDRRAGWLLGIERDDQ